eukprot:evm.model.NODE_25705_length_11249_cov_27.909681.3
MLNPSSSSSSSSSSSCSPLPPPAPPNPDIDDGGPIGGGTIPPPSPYNRSKYACSSNVNNTCCGADSKADENPPTHGETAIISHATFAPYLNGLSCSRKTPGTRHNNTGFQGPCAPNFPNK